MPLSNVAAREWLARATGIEPSALRLTRMRGATSSTLHLVSDANRPAGPRFVLRLFTLAPWLAEEPDLAPHEVAALAEARRTDLTVPEPLDFLPGPSRDHPDDPAGFGVPAVLMSFVPGRVELDPADERAWLREAARSLVAIHGHEAPGFPWRYRSWVQAGNVAVPSWSRRPAVWEAAIEAYAAWRPAPAEDTFLHRDYHPTNLLFEGGGSGIRVSAVVDWVNACTGPAAADVSHCRVDLLQMKGPAAAADFLEHYRDLRGTFDYDPVWDLEAVFDVAMPSPSFYPPWGEFGLSPVPEPEARRRVEQHVLRALAELGVSV